LNARNSFNLVIYNLAFEWPIWSEKFFTKTKLAEFKDMLLVKVNIPMAGEEIN
jgi:hypothetical protein